MTYLFKINESILAALRHRLALQIPDKLAMFVFQVLFAQLH